MNLHMLERVLLSTGIIFLLFVFSETGCAKKTDELLLGKWSGTAVDSGGEEVLMKMKFFEDNRVNFISGECEAIEGTYEIDGDNVIIASFKDDTDGSTAYQFRAIFEGADVLTGEMTTKIKGLSKAYDVLKRDMEGTEDNSEEEFDRELSINEDIQNEMTIVNKVSLNRIN